MAERRRPCDRASVEGSEFYLLGHLLAVFIAKVPVGFHGQRTAVFMPEPARDRWNVHARFNAAGRKQVAQVMVGNSLDTQNLRGPVN